MAKQTPVLVRRASPKSFVGPYAGIGFFALVCFVAAAQLREQRTPQFIIGGLGLAGLAGGIGIVYLIRRTTEYRIYDDHLEIESGLITKKLENVKLFRVRDLGLLQGTLGLLLGFGDVTITSTDTTAPHVTIRAVDTPKEIYDQISELMAVAQAQRRTMIIEDMPMAESEAAHA